MNRRVLLRYLFFIILMFFCEQNIFAQKSLKVDAKVKIRIIKKIGILFVDKIPSKKKYTIASGNEIQKRDLLINYQTNKISTVPLLIFEPKLKIVRNNNSSISVLMGSEKELRQVAYDEPLYLNMSSEFRSHHYWNRYLVTIVY